MVKSNVCARETSHQVEKIRAWQLILTAIVVISCQTELPWRKRPNFFAGLWMADSWPNYPSSWYSESIVGSSIWHSQHMVIQLIRKQDYSYLDWQYLLRDSARLLAGDVDFVQGIHCLPDQGWSTRRRISLLPTPWIREFIVLAILTQTTYNVRSILLPSYGTVCDCDVTWFPSQISVNG